MTGPKAGGEWDAASDSWTDFQREGKDFFRVEMNLPAFFAVVGDVKGLRVLDLGCGEGSNARFYASGGAKVVGVDISRKMIELARRTEERDRLGIEYVVSDAANIKGVSGGFDLVTCFMALMDIEHYEEAIVGAAKLLRAGGRFVFCITHPCFEFGECVDRESLAVWKYETEESKQRGEAHHIEMTDYFQRGTSEVIWDMERLKKPFTTTSFHRTLTDYFEALTKAGFMVSRLVEPKPTPIGVSNYPSLRKHLKIPHSITIEATKVSPCGCG